MPTATSFTLDARLASDTQRLGATPFCELLLMNDARWPWLILVPRVADATELHSLSPEQHAGVFDEIRTASRTMQASTGCRSVNVAALGNRVAQLHVHVVARDEGDANWPGPIWGHGRAEPRTGELLPAFAAAVRDALVV